MRCVNACLGVLLVTVWLGPAAWAQPSTGPRASDTTSPDAIIAALYDVISGPAGQARDWDRFRGLFARRAARPGRAEAGRIDSGRVVAG